MSSSDSSKEVTCDEVVQRLGELKDGQEQAAREVRNEAPRLDGGHVHVAGAVLAEELVHALEGLGERPLSRGLH